MKIATIQYLFCIPNSFDVISRSAIIKTVLMTMPMKQGKLIMPTIAWQLTTSILNMITEYSRWIKSFQRKINDAALLSDQAFIFSYALIVSLMKSIDVFKKIYLSKKTFLGLS